MRKFYSSATTLHYPTTAISLPLAGRGRSHAVAAFAVARKVRRGAVRAGNCLLGVNIPSLTFGFALLIAGLVILNLFFANNLSTKGEEVRVLESRKAVLVKNNEELRNEIAYLSSLSRLKKDASEQLGMVEASQVAVDYLRPLKFASRY